MELKRSLVFRLPIAVFRALGNPQGWPGRRSIFIVIVAVLLPSLFTPQSAGREMRTTKGGYHRSVDWVASDMSHVQGLQLYLLDFKCCIAERILLVPSHGSAMLFDHSIDLATGEQRVRLGDSSDRWWLEVVDRHDVRAENTHQYFQFLLGGYKEAKKSSFLRRVLSSNGQVEGLEINYGEKNWQLQMLDQLEKADALGGSMFVPTTARSIAQMFRSSLDSELDLARGLGSVGAPLYELILAADQPEHLSGDIALNWALEELGNKEWSLSISNPELLELMSRFPNLENVDPFQGMLGLEGIESPR